MRMCRSAWPSAQVLGKATMNIGTIQGGLVPNIVPESATARLSFRIVDPMQQIIERVTQGTSPSSALRPQRSN